VNALVLRVAATVLAVSFSAWIVLFVTILVGRSLHDRWQVGASGVLTHRRARRLVLRARGRPRTNWGRSRRAVALSRLARAGHSAAPRLLRRAVEDTDLTVATAATRSLGELGDGWAIELLLDALRAGHVPRSRVAAQLERLAPLPGARLLALLHDPDPAVRFWGATLLAPYPDLGQSSLLELTRDPDPNVRAAAVETLGVRDDATAGPAILALLQDPVWFVRVHAARSAGHVLGPASAPALVELLADPRWWVRSAAKDALRGMGRDAVSALVPVLRSSDRFARNGSAEVLQDIGFVDHLVLEEPSSPLLAWIFAAGGRRLRETAELRAARLRAEEEAQAA